MRKIRIQFTFFAYLIIVVAVWLGFARIVYGETHIHQNLIDRDTVWDKSGSPYILDNDLSVLAGVTLTIGEGVEVQARPYTNRVGNPVIFVRAGTLNINGSALDRASIKGFHGINVENGNIQIYNTDLIGKFGLSLTNSVANISTTTISGADRAIISRNSIVKIEASKITDNLDGIRVIPNQIILIRNGQSADGVGRGMGGIGNALEVNPSFTISNSIISGNRRVGLANFAEYQVQAKSNWWGVSSGPLRSGPNQVTGVVAYDPWLGTEPDLSAKPVDPCCSSILFIPGLQASRLEQGDNRLWEPNRNEDVRKLFLDENGQSIEKDIYVNGPIDEAFGIVSIYGEFLEFLDELVGEGTLNQWKVFGYDWRRPISEVVAGRERTATTTVSLLETVSQVAAGSKTGKVSIIAHSNGGLVAKYLMMTLAEQGNAHLVDKVISVAVPYLGTPQAILALLHGHNQSIAKGLILKAETAKDLGENMPSAYSLLPSVEYFKHVLGPTIVLASSTITDNAAQSDHIASQKNPILVSAANALHVGMDLFQWPLNISRWAIVGWNVVTSKSLSYRNKSYFASTTSMGDGTVVAPSAAYDSGTVVSLDLSEDKKDIDHANILESPRAQDIIKQILTRPTLELPDGASFGEPDYSKEKNMLVVSTHSPVELHAYDEVGNHTGLIDLPEGVEEGLFTSFEEGIPGSSFRQYGDEADPEMYVYLPDAAQPYSLIIKGTNVGTATLEVERIRGGETLEKIAFDSFPVMPMTIASTTATGGSVQSTEAVQLDIDGNGSSDVSINPGETNNLLYRDMLQKMISTLLGSTKMSTDLNRKNAVDKLQKKIGHKKFDQLTESEKQQVLDLVELLIAKFQ